MYKFGGLQKKILLILLGGIALGISRSPSQYFRTICSIKREWNKIDQRSFNRSLKRLSQEKLIEEKKLSDGSFKLVLTEKGKKEAKKLSLLGNSIKFTKPKRWDRKWRVVLFDIPEKDRIFRDILREHLKALEFYKLQHSVFVSPYPFEKSIMELADLYSAKQYVRVITAIAIDTQNKIKKHFFKKVT